MDTWKMGLMCSWPVSIMWKWRPLRTVLKPITVCIVLIKIPGIAGSTSSGLLQVFICFWLPQIWACWRTIDQRNVFFCKSPEPDREMTIFSNIVPVKMQTRSFCNSEAENTLDTKMICTTAAACEVRRLLRKKNWLKKTFLFICWKNEHCKFHFSLICARILSLNSVSLAHSWDREP